MNPKSSAIPNRTPSLLFGAGAQAGVVRYITNKLKINVAEGPIIVAVLSLVVLGSGGAMAETATNTEAGAESSDLQEIVVTAQRRSEHLEKVPISVTAIAPATMEALNIESISDIGLVTPNLVFDTGYTFSQIYIRGIGASTASGVGLETPVAVYVDGAYITRQTGTIYDLVDPGSIEVLRGPQGTLYGHNSSGGTILLNSADPTNKFTFDGKLEYGNYGHTLENVVLNAPLSDTLAVRVAAQYRNDDGFVYNVTTHEWVRGQEDGTLRVKAKWTPTDQLTAALTLNYNKQSINAATSGRNDISDALCAGCGSPQPVSFYQVTEDFQRVDANASKGANLRLEYDMGKIKIKSVSAYYDVASELTDDSDHSAAADFHYDSEYGGKTFTEELQTSSSFDGMINFLAGAVYIHDDAYAQNNLWGNIFGIPGGSTLPPGHAGSVNDVYTKSYAAYGEIYIRPINPLTITLGARYSSDSRSLYGYENPVSQQIFGGPSTFQNYSSDNKVTPRVVVAYDAGAVNYYASYNQGFKSGGFSVPLFAPSTTPIGPETIDSYEVGAKFVSSSGLTRINSAAFFYKYKDVQVGIVEQPSQIFTNAAAAQGKGLEVDLNQQVGDWLHISAGVGYLDAHYTNYPNGVVNLPGASGGIVVGGADLAGTSLPRAPEFTGNLATLVKVPLGSNWIGHWDTVVSYTSGYLFDAGAGGPLNTDRQDAYTLVNTTVSISPVSQEYSLGFYVNNAANTRYYEIRALGSVPLALNSIVAPPITFGVHAAFHFK